MEASRGTAAGCRRNELRVFLVPVFCVVRRLPARHRALALFVRLRAGTAHVVCMTRERLRKLVRIPPHRAYRGPTSTNVEPRPAPCSCFVLK